LAQLLAMMLLDLDLAQVAQEQELAQELQELEQPAPNQHLDQALALAQAQATLLTPRIHLAQVQDLEPTLIPLTWAL
jgi:hypothetical protein